MDVAPWDEALDRMRAALERLEAVVEKKLRLEAKRAESAWLAYSEVHRLFY